MGKVDEGRDAFAAGSWLAVIDHLQAATEWVERAAGVEDGKPVFTDGGEPQHDGGIVASGPGLFCGLHFQRAASSETVTGMPRDGVGPRRRSRRSTFGFWARR